MRKDLLTALKLLSAGLALVGCTDPSEFDETMSLEDQSPVEFECDLQRPTPAFCDDFDDVPIGSQMIPYLRPSAQPGLFSRNNAAARSGVQSLVARINAPYTPDQFNASETYAGSWGFAQFGQLKGEAVRVRVSFDLRLEEVEAPGTTARISAYQFLFGNDASYNQFVLNFANPSGTVVAEFTEGKGSVTNPVGDPAATISGGFLVPVGLNEWRHFVMDLDVNDPYGIGNSARVTLDDALLFNGNLEFPLRGAVPRMELGITWADPVSVQGPWQIRYDNVLVFIVPK